MYHYFYKITNKLNQKYYVGIHSTENLEDGYFGSGVLLRKEIKKYGKENFEKEILDFFDSREELSEHEKWYIKTYNCQIDQNCYNIAIGGDNYNLVNKLSLKHIITGKIAVYNIKDKDVIKMRKLGLLISCSKGYKAYLNLISKEIEYLLIDDEETKEKLNKGEIISCNKGKTGFLNLITGQKEFVSITDPRITEGILVGHTKGKSIYYNSLLGKYELSSPSDERVLNKILISINKNYGQYIEIETGKRLRLKTNNPETIRLLKEKKIEPFSKNKKTVLDLKTGKNKYLDINDKRLQDKENYISVTKNLCPYLNTLTGKTEMHNIKSQKTKEYISKGILKTYNQNIGIYKDINGNILRLDINDPETKKMISDGLINGITSGRIKIIKRTGEKSSCYIKDLAEKKKEGWKVGDRIYHIKKDNLEKIVFKEELLEYYKNGWDIGIKSMRLHKDKISKLFRIEHIEKRIHSEWSYHSN